MSLRREILVSPDCSQDYNFSKPLEKVLKDNGESRENLAIEMDKEFFKGKLWNGFFIEAGAYDGEWTLDFSINISLIFKLEIDLCKRVYINTHWFV